MSDSSPSFHIVCLINKLFDKRLAYQRLTEEQHSFFDSREEAFDAMIEAENDLSAALDSAFGKDKTVSRANEPKKVPGKKRRRPVEFENAELGDEG